MLRIFQDELLDPANFVTTLELVPARESRGMRIDTLKGIARDAFADGRISAVSITDNPGGNPSLSPDVLGYEIFKLGLDVIVHFTCRDMNRVGMESRALQLARMGMKNILALTGDYSGKGFGGQGKPVFDFDSVILTDMLQQLTQRLYKGGEPDGFFTGCAVSPFKYTKAEALVQYQKLDNKLSAGAGFVITQLGYDVEKFTELMMVLGQRGKIPPVMGSVYLLSPRSARAMNRGRVPGAHIGDALLTRVLEDWRNKPAGLKKSIERAAVLGAVLKGLGFRGIHIGGIHRSFKTVGAILDRMEEIQDSWQEHLEELSLETRPGGYYQFGNQAEVSSTPSFAAVVKNRLQDRYPFTILKNTHQCFFVKERAFSPFYKKIAQTIDTANKAWLVKTILEDPFKKLFLSCQGCGDCAIQHLSFLCPESGCPKHTRNGPCGGSRNKKCEVTPEKTCVWVRAYERAILGGSAHELARTFVPPRMWELNNTSSWINFHLERDHHASSMAVTKNKPGTSPP